MIAIIPANPRTVGTGRTAFPFKSARARITACPAISCRGNIRRMPAVMFIAQATDTLQLLRDVGSGCPINSADDVRSPRLAAISRHA
jgi:hypothetical protein